MSQDIRTFLHSAFAYVRGTEVNKATAALTLDHLLQEQINALKKGEARSVLDGRGAVIGKRLSRWDQLDALEKNIEQATKAIEEAGNDSAKLEALGIVDTDAPSVEDDAPSSTVEGALQ